MYLTNIVYMLSATFGKKLRLWCRDVSNKEVYAMVDHFKTFSLTLHGLMQLLNYLYIDPDKVQIFRLRTFKYGHFNQIWQVSIIEF